MGSMLLLFAALENGPAGPLQHAGRQRTAGKERPAASGMRQYGLSPSFPATALAAASARSIGNS